eukprot:2436191-Rhodomonas_salina.3
MGRLALPESLCELIGTLRAGSSFKVASYAVNIRAVDAMSGTYIRYDAIRSYRGRASLRCSSLTLQVLPTRAPFLTIVGDRYWHRPCYAMPGTDIRTAWYAMPGPGLALVTRCLVLT